MWDPRFCTPNMRWRNSRCTPVYKGVCMYKGVCCTWSVCIKVFCYASTLGKLAWLRRIYLPKYPWIPDIIAYINFSTFPKILLRTFWQKHHLYTGISGVQAACGMPTKLIFRKLLQNPIITVGKRRKNVIIWRKII